MLKNLLSAAVVIGALRVKILIFPFVICTQIMFVCPYIACLVLASVESCALVLAIVMFVYRHWPFFIQLLLQVLGKQMWLPNWLQTFSNMQVNDYILLTNREDTKITQVLFRFSDFDLNSAITCLVIESNALMKNL